jgi:hypothetical protein
VKSFVRGIFLMVAVCGISFAQQTPSNAPAAQTQNPLAQAVPSSPTPSNSEIKIAPGSVIPAQLTKSIDAKKVKTGDQVEAQVTEDLKAGNGEIIVPKNTRVIGRVTEAQARTKEQKESQVGIAFERAVMKNKADLPLPMSIQAVISPTYLSNASSTGSSQPNSIPDPGSGSRSGNNGRAGSAGAPPSSSPTGGNGEEAAAAGSTGKSRLPITGDTKGVLGIENLKLSANADASQGSVLSSEKNNVKLEGGTLLLLRVN